MALTVVSVAAAVAVLGYDLLTNRPDVGVGAGRRTIRAIGLTGSAAAGDSAVDVKVGNRTVVSLYNTALGFPTNDAGKFPTMYHVPPGSPVSIIVTDAPATNPLNVLIDV